MKIIIFGATGAIGQHVLEQALESGYQVSAFCRNTDKLNHLNHLNLDAVQGDVFNPKEVQNAIQNHDAVVIVLGSGKKRTGTVRSEGTKNIIEAMHMKGVKRLVCQTTLGAGESQGNLNFFWRNIMFGWFLKRVFQDHELQEQYVNQSSLDWTIIRPGAFLDGEKTGAYKHGFDPTDKSLKLKIAKADVADFILKQLDSGLYLLKSPGLSY